MSAALDMTTTAKKAVETITWSPHEGKITIRDGREIDVTGRYWRIPTATNRFTIDWGDLRTEEGDLKNAIRRWIAHLLRTQSPTAACAGYRQAMPFFHAPAFLKSAATGGSVPYLAFSQAQAALGQDQRWQLHYARHFYRWCESQRFRPFATEVARKLDLIVIGGNKKGRAVRSSDPDKGPLDAMEVASLALALRAARVQGIMPLEEQAAVWLALAFGANASQFAAMREEDINPQFLGDQLGTTLVKVPRHKKGHIQPRAEFQTRKANRFVGRILMDLVEENKAKHRPNDADAARPLFWRQAPLDRGPSLKEWSWHFEAFDFTLLLKRGIKRLRVLSRTGKLLHISTRRLRYSMASRMVQEGASKYAVAAALDHTDLQNVETYFDVHSGIVDHIDRALAMVLGARANAFATLVERESDAVNGNKVTSRRYYGDREKGIFEPIGTCGNNFLCNVTSPYGCYVCPKFQAWVDGPHDLVLDALIESRTRREELRLDPKVIAIEDELIAHVANVIHRAAEYCGTQAGAA